MLQVESIHPIRRIITREYDEEGRLVREEIKEFGDPLPPESPSWKPCDLKITCEAGTMEEVDEKTGE